MSSHLAKAIKSASGKDDEEESNEPDYDEDKDQLEEEQEEHRGEVTINQVLISSHKIMEKLLLRYAR